ncbi:hypothetical protein LCGC14_1526340 [marine sediment metagenome]|uniref:Uncharacterized protein n=1 Tax=marine sediment metagenome TaxID=412755 RepID=A0A0F9JI23_9ZZZZ
MNKDINKHKVCVKCDRPETSIHTTFDQDRFAIWGMDKNKDMKKNIRVIFFCDNCAKEIDNQFK